MIRVVEMRIDAASPCRRRSIAGRSLSDCLPSTCGINSTWAPRLLDEVRHELLHHVPIIDLEPEHVRSIAAGRQ